MKCNSVHYSVLTKTGRISVWMFDRVSLIGANLTHDEMKFHSNEFANHEKSASPL